MTDNDAETSPPPTPFHDLDAYVAMPRVSGLTLSPDGRRLVTGVATLNPEETRYVTSLWEVDPAGERPARRLTRSAKGESGAAYLPDGSLLFCSARPDPESSDDDEVPMLWLLPADGGEARVVAKRPGGVGGVAVAREAGTVVVSSDTFPSATDAESDEAKRKERKEKKVSAVLHESYPVRYWDHDLGPDRPRLLAGQLEPGNDAADERAVELRDLTPDAGRAFERASYDISADGTLIVSTWNVPRRGGYRQALVAFDATTGERRMLADEADYEYGEPQISPDGTTVAVIRQRSSTSDDPGDRNIAVVSVADGSVRELTAAWDLWPGSAPQWTPDGTALIVTADQNGRGPVFRLDVATEQVTRLTADDYTYSDVCVAPDGQWVYALRTSYVEPMAPVRLAVDVADQNSESLRGPAPVPELPGTLEEIETAADDGTRIRAWLALPEGTSPEAPAPMLLWIHGGPMNSWNAWSWRWNPWIMVAHGYAVLLPDPALSTGYGLDFIRRGWGAWGQAPFTDLMAITDATVARRDIDDNRTAAMGGSFGGYMANWVAGQTDRFDAIVTHASLWALDDFGPTTDAAWYWVREMTPQMAEANSPHHHVSAIETPMLVIHGDKDYRVPVGQALRLWFELAYQFEDDSLPHKFLYFPDENHWILTPQHAKIWYETILAFLEHHVLGKDWETPSLLR
ncbi:S9 family peptidase [Actinobacteria bacterium YIM 96077]|uniref:S9 family peptidase n=1 Tax=Phytoactinopolyspora halophila TaxID=1981511 RepID=A0A329R0L7_9ACTN|nr:prolyl oligopeptidase family serine peptidase [Phytoactinopolyspora halophila]AYY11664.1 S9 family peptidase [Actinobacteria bacterium YIM 96077]RAW17903.1 S9 family peptidase [Phytoactinopolyspora halophila]